MLCYILKELSKKRFDYFINDFLVIAEKLAALASKIQDTTPQKNLTILYLIQLPTGKNMLYYIVGCKIRSLVENTYVRTLIYEFWNQSYTKKGTRSDYSNTMNFLQNSKRFEWSSSFEQDITKNFSFQLQFTVISAKINLITEIIFLFIFYYFLEDHIYMKQDFFLNAEMDSNYINTLDPYHIDPVWSISPTAAILQLFVFINYWSGLLFRLIAFRMHNCKIPLYTWSHIVLFIVLTSVLICYPVLNSYQSQLDNRLLITTFLIALRFALAFTLCSILLMFKGLGTIIQVVLRIGKQFALLVVLVSIFMLLVSEYFNNLFANQAQLFNTVGESFFSLTEMLFGSLTFINLPDVQYNNDYYYMINISMTIWTFFSNIAFNFLMIATITKIYNTTLQEVEYKRTKFQYNIINFHSNIAFKGFHAFPPIISFLIFPLFFVYISNKCDETKFKINKFLLKIQYYLTVAPWIVIREACYLLIITLPSLYIKKLLLLLQGKVNSFYNAKCTRICHLILWILFGMFHIIINIFADMVRLFRILIHNQDVDKAKLYVLGDIVISNDDDVYIERFSLIKEMLKEYVNENPKAHMITIDELVNCILKRYNLNEQDDLNLPVLSPGKSIIKSKKKSFKMRLADVIRKHKIGKLKTKSNIGIDPKEIKGFIKALDNMLNIKNAQYNTFKEAELEIHVMQELLANITLKSVVYLKLKRLSLIQSALIEVQDTDLVTVLKRLDDVEDKMNVLLDEVKNIAKYIINTKEGDNENIKKQQNLIFRSK